MTQELNDIFQSVLALPRESRALLAHQLLDSLLPEDSSQKEWQEAARDSSAGFLRAMSPGLPADRLLQALGSRLRT